MSQRHIVIGVTASIALHRALDLCSELRKDGHRLSVCMTESAARLIAPQTFQAISLGNVYSSLWEMREDFDHDHIRLAQDGDLMLIAPITASTIGKLAQGIFDNVLTTTAAAFVGPVLFAPAMNWRMWQHPAVTENVARLQEFGWELLHPVEGDLACGEQGPGRMAPVDAILERVRARLEDG